jgi:hypothetical protein
MPPRKKTFQKKIKKPKTHLWKLPLSPNIFWPIFIVLFFFLVLSIVNFVSLWQLRVDLRESLQLIKIDNNLPVNSKGTDNTNNEMGETMTVDLPTIKQDLLVNTNEISSLDQSEKGEEFNFDSADELALIEEPVLAQQSFSGTVASFGDIFSGLAYINRDETDMFWDETVTAFSLPPVYDLKKQNDCAFSDCGLSRDEVDPIKICLASGCLSKDENNRLFFNDRPLLLPPALDNLVITNTTIFALGDQWLIGLVTGPTEIERAFVYRFDGLSFSPLFTDTTTYQINPRYQRGNGKIAFGGSSDDFLVLYSGYDGKAFRVRGNEIEDVSHFFGLRVTNGGFVAQIFKIGTGADANFYICGLDQYKPLFLKLWSKDETSSGGAINLANAAFSGAFRTDSILCAISNANEKKIALASSYGSANELWIFQDLGFDISKSRKITSVNINRKAYQTKAAVIVDQELNYLDNFQYYLANNENSFQAVDPYLWQSFEQSGNSLYWRLELSPGNNQFYSPWFNHLNRLDYLFE